MCYFEIAMLTLLLLQHTNAQVAVSRLVMFALSLYYTLLLQCSPKAIYYQVLVPNYAIGRSWDL